MKQNIEFDVKGKKKVRVSRMIQTKLNESTKEWKMKSLHEIMNIEINEKYTKGDNVRPINKKDKYYGKMGIVWNVGKGMKKGAQTIKFPDGQVVSYNDDELEMPKLAEAMNPDDKVIMNKSRAYFKKKYGAKNVGFRTTATKTPILHITAKGDTKFDSDDMVKAGGKADGSYGNISDTYMSITAKEMKNILGESLDEYDFNTHAKTVSRTKRKGVFK